MRYRFDPVYPRDPRRAAPGRASSSLRASDAERAEVADRLSRHFADGRLDQPEFKARLDRAMGATTRGDLAGLFDDLPPLPDEAPPRRRRRLGPAAVTMLFVVLAATWILQYAFDPFRVPWLLVLVIGYIAWRRLGRRRPSHYSGADRERYDHRCLP